MSGSVPGVDPERLAPWFRASVAPLDELSASIIGHGRSNLTYRLDGGGGSWVLRRPPLSHVQPTAHDMSREFRVISALADTEVPVPKALAFCDDGEVIGAPFYVMEYVSGFVSNNPADFGREFDEAQRRALGEQLIDILVHLHALDPARVGLADFGKPEGYLQRQVRRFSEQIDRVESKREVAELRELSRRLAAAVPAESDHSIVHGDYRLDNAIIHDGRIVAVLDWEMATLGDPLADLGILRMYWPDRDSAGSPLAIASNTVMTLPGFPTWQEGAARYSEKSGRDLVNLDFYVVLAHFKLAVILENMYARYLAGGTVGAGFEIIGDQAVLLARRGLDVAGASSIPALRRS